MNSIEIKVVKQLVLSKFREVIEKSNDYKISPKIYEYSRHLDKISRVARFSRLPGIENLCTFISSCFKVVENSSDNNVRHDIILDIGELLNSVGLDLVNLKNLPLINYESAQEISQKISSKHDIPVKAYFAFLDIAWNSYIKASQEDFNKCLLSDTSVKDFFQEGLQTTKRAEFAAAFYICLEALNQGIEYDFEKVRSLIRIEGESCVIDLADMCHDIYQKIDIKKASSSFRQIFIGRKASLILQDPPEASDTQKFLSVLNSFKDSWISVSSSRAMGSILKFSSEFKKKSSKMKSSEFDRLCSALYHAVCFIDKSRSDGSMSEVEWNKISDSLWIDGATCIQMMEEIIHSIKAGGIVPDISGSVEAIEKTLLSYGASYKRENMELPDSLMSKRRESSYKTLIDNMLSKFNSIQRVIDAKSTEFMLGNIQKDIGVNIYNATIKQLDSVIGCGRFLQMTHLIDSCEHLKKKIKSDDTWKNEGLVKEVIDGISQITIHLESIDLPMPEDLPHPVFTPELEEIDGICDVREGDEYAAVDAATLETHPVLPDASPIFSEDPVDEQTKSFSSIESVECVELESETVNTLEELSDSAQDTDTESDFFDSVTDTKSSKIESIFSNNDENRFDEVPEGVLDQIDSSFLTILIDEINNVHPQIEAVFSSWRKSDAEEKDEFLALLNSLKRHVHTIKGACRTIGFMVEGYRLHLIEDEIESYEGEIPPTRFIDTYEIAIDNIVDAVKEKARSSIELPTEVITDDIRITEEKPAIEQQESIRVSTKTIQEIGDSSNEVSVLNTKTSAEISTAWKSMDELTSNLDRLSLLLKELEVQAEVGIQAGRNASTEGFDPLQLDRYTRLNEITRSLSENIQDIQSSKSDLSSVLGRIEENEKRKTTLSETIQSETSKLMVVPFNSQKSRIDKVIQKACRETGKMAEVIHIGDMDVPGALLEKLVPVIEHVLRNSITHGIEDREQRRMAGKNERGSVYINVKNEGSHCSISVRDDGAGIDKVSILNKAIEKGFIRATDNPSEKEIFDILFLPGFSTAKSVTTLAGRGVGLDAVKQSVSELGGSISVYAERGQFCEFKLDIPIDISTAMVVPMSVSGYSFMVPSNLVVKVATTTSARLSSTLDGDEIILDGLHCKYVQGRSLFGDVCAKPSKSQKGYAHIAICGVDENNLMALHVDHIESYRKVVVRPISKHIASIPGLVAGSVMGDGTPCLIMNPMRMSAQAQTLITEGDENTSKVVMVVDDSSTVRMVASRFLRKQGFEVIEAIDGVEALDHIKNGVSPDIFLLDIEMPRMDGFELTEALRKIESTQFTPIIMITSRIAQKHREHALNLGVDEYLGKPYEEKELLSLMKKYLYYSMPA